MTTSAAILLLLSASFHAAWNLLGKRNNPSAAFMLAANTLGCLFLLPALIWSHGQLPGFSAQIQLFLLLTGLCQAVYYAALAGAYQSGDLSVAYPLARSLPTLFVAGLTTWLGIGKSLSPWAVLGILLVVTGCLIVPLQNFSTRSWRNYWRPSILLAFVAALGTAGYSLVDSEALRLLRQSTTLAAGPVQATLLYAFLEGISSSLWLALFVALRRPERLALRSLAAQKLQQPLLVGIGIYLGYLLVLFAMGLVTNVSYVVAFRQLSIPFGALLGIWILKEPPHPTKFIGVGLAFTGLILVGLG